MAEGPDKKDKQAFAKLERELLEKQKRGLKTVTCKRCNGTQAVLELKEGVMGENAGWRDYVRVACPDCVARSRQKNARGSKVPQ